MTGLRVILIGKDNRLLKSIEESLRFVGCIILGRANEEYAAIKAIRATQPDFIIIDAEVGFIEIAKTVDENSLAPLLLVTGNNFLQNAATVIESWGFQCLEKPFTTERLKMAVAVGVEKYHKNRKDAADRERLHSFKTTRNIVNKAKQILVENLGLTEFQAITRIQILSYDKKITIRDMAEKIIRDDTSFSHREAIM